MINFAFPQWCVHPWSLVHLAHALRGAVTITVVLMARSAAPMDVDMNVQRQYHLTVL